MEIKINRIDDAFLMEAENESGQSLRMDGSSAIGGAESAMRPMQTLLASLGGCSAIDVISILKKQRQTLDKFSVTLNGKRAENETPAVFKEIHIHFDLYGNLEEAKVRKAIELSVFQYCSVAKMLEKTAKISYDFSIHFN